jgi:hypothetical protein
VNATPIAWRSRGIGLDEVPGCFVCGQAFRSEEAAKLGNHYLHNIAAFISKEDEGAALACFDQGARMGYYHGDKNVPQIKVGACDAHLKALEHLSTQWYISPKRVQDLVRVARKRGS